MPDVGATCSRGAIGSGRRAAAVAALFGEEAITGRLPIPLPPFHELGEGLDRPKVADRLATLEIEDPVVAAGIIAARGGGPRGSNQTVAEPATVGMSAEGLDACRLDSSSLASPIPRSPARR